MIKDWKDRLKDLCKGYKHEDTYNMDETGLFWRALPKKSLTMKDEKSKGGKQSKERITILMCVNVSSTDKLKLMVIGKSENPRAFKN
jgi:hypothetical protein